MDFKLTILEYYDHVNSICSFYRGRGVWAELERLGYVNLILSNWQEDWTTIRRCDIAYFQRPVSKHCLKQVMMCKDLGLKIWIDLDDWIDCPAEHPIYKKYNDIFDLNVFKKILLLSDVISVSTKNLSKLLIEKFDFIIPKIHIIPNAINDYIFVQLPLSEKKIIVWRGGENHLYDIQPYCEEIREILEVYPDWLFYALGSDVIQLSDLPNYVCLENLDIHSYFAFLYRCTPSVILVPLKCNEFNQAKSNIAWLEATRVGAISVMPAWTDDNISFQYSDNKSFKYAFIDALNYANMRAFKYEESVKKIQSEYLLSDINKLRLLYTNMYDTGRI